MGIIYFIRAGDRNLFKIGITKNGISLRGRLLSIKSQLNRYKYDLCDPSVLDCELNAYRYKEMPRYNKLEKDVHRALYKVRFKMFRSIGDEEWFGITKGDVDDIIDTGFSDKRKSFNNLFKKTRLYSQLLDEQIEHNIACYREGGDCWLALSVLASNILDSMEEREKLNFPIKSGLLNQWDSVKTELMIDNGVLKKSFTF